MRGDRGKDHDPAAMTPNLAPASHRARLRQDRCAPLRGGLRSVLTQSPLDAPVVHGPGRKAVPQAEQKASFGLQSEPRLKNEETPLSRTRKHHSVSVTTSLQTLTDTTVGSRARQRSSERWVIARQGFHPGSAEAPIATVAALESIAVRKLRRRDDDEDMSAVWHHPVRPRHHSGQGTSGAKNSVCETEVLTRGF